MTKKEVYYLALDAAGAALRSYFQMGRGEKSFDHKYFQQGRGKAIAKDVFDVLAEQLVSEVEQSEQ